MHVCACVLMCECVYACVYVCSCVSVCMHVCVYLMHQLVLLSVEYMLVTMLVRSAYNSCKLGRPGGLRGSLMNVGPHSDKYLY